ncbi:MBL fold metallo-hydrolase [Prochlorococcus marinus XMU1411]|uniref:MBL fold metallo-hydrolase n=1 Tax=Prochlorococcus marinus TaxID=1219 RepID=UPI001ADA1ED8|nr:MBL fold metallo-hydrolase [Prochlorococcus marinus]MBO8243902.1 MBL fold metallo-hydrolase [Prochlorococcus marinus XMU1411]MBW3055000.1 MBL fold metallo-hydrolase [Prochlorococcus marinus str. MU1411]MCR8538592.1 MBL fold metallo-hydrolase [Prochlorococcus marinus CUG1430]
MAFEATYLGSNGWLIKFPKTSLIIDPWLKGDLIFPPGEWFFKGSLEKEISIDKEIDIILLTQGLPDHCHVPTLEMFRKDIPIICPKSAIETLKKIGFNTIKLLKPNEKTSQFNLSFEATAGAPVPQIENGYIVKDDQDNGFYIEPHGYLDKNLNKQNLDAVITPTKNLELPLVGSFVKGADVIPKLINKFSPKFILSSTVGGDATYSGFLNNFISVQEYKEELNSNLVDLKSMQSIMI